MTPKHFLRSNASEKSSQKITCFLLLCSDWESSHKTSFGTSLHVCAAGCLWTLQEFLQGHLSALLLLDYSWAQFDDPPLIQCCSCSLNQYPTGRLLFGKSNASVIALPLPCLVSTLLFLSPCFLSSRTLRPGRNCSRYITASPYRQSCPYCC